MGIFELDMHQKIKVQIIYQQEMQVQAHTHMQCHPQFACDGVQT